MKTAVSIVWALALLGVGYMAYTEHQHLKELAVLEEKRLARENRPLRDLSEPIRFMWRDGWDGAFTYDASYHARPSYLEEIKRTPEHTYPYIMMGVKTYFAQVDRDTWFSAADNKDRMKELWEHIELYCVKHGYPITLNSIDVAIENAISHLHGREYSMEYEMPGGDWHPEMPGG